MSVDPLDYDQKHKGLIKFLHGMKQKSSKPKLKEVGPRTKAINKYGNCFEMNLEERKPNFYYIIRCGKLLLDLHVPYLSMCRGLLFSSVN
jgi:hypothetical protein